MTDEWVHFNVALPPPGAHIETMTDAFGTREAASGTWCVGSADGPIPETVQPGALMTTRGLFIMAPSQWSWRLVQAVGRPTS